MQKYASINFMSTAQIYVPFSHCRKRAYTLVQFNIV